jgi:hypothetical protein
MNRCPVSVIISIVNQSRRHLVFVFEHSHLLSLGIIGETARPALAREFPNATVDFELPELQ